MLDRNRRCPPTASGHLKQQQERPRGSVSLPTMDPGTECRHLLALKCQACFIFPVKLAAASCCPSRTDLLPQR